MESRNKRCSSGLIVALAAILLAACASDPTPAPAPTLDPESAAGRGLRLFEANCAACHAIEDGVVLSGPPLAHIALIAESRIEGMTAEDYLRESIVNPNAYAIRGYQTGLMRQDFGRTLTSDNVSDIVAYLMTLK